MTTDWSGDALATGGGASIRKGTLELISADILESSELAIALEVPHANGLVRGSAEVS